MRLILFIFLLVNLLPYNKCNAQPRIIGANNVVTILAGEAIPNWSLVRISAGKAWKANNTKIDSAAVAIAIDTAFATNDTIQVAYGGTLQGFAIEKGKDYYLGTGGTFTATKPTSIFTQKIGTWVEDSTLQLNIQHALPIYNTEQFINLTSDASNSTVTPTDITDFSFTGEASTSYVIKFYGLVVTGANTTGVGLLIDAPDGATVVAGSVKNQLASQTLTSMQQIVDASIAGTTTTNGTGTSGNPATAMSTFLEGVWLVTVGSSGTVKMQLRSEIGSGFSTVTVKAGSKMSYLKI